MFLNVENLYMLLFHFNPPPSLYAYNTGLTNGKKPVKPGKEIKSSIVTEIETRKTVEQTVFSNSLVE